MITKYKVQVSSYNTGRILAAYTDGKNELNFCLPLSVLKLNIVATSPQVCLQSKPVPRVHAEFPAACLSVQ